MKTYRKHYVKTTCQLFDAMISRHVACISFGIFLTFLFLIVVHHPAKETGVKCENLYKTLSKNNMPAFLDICVQKTGGAGIKSAIDVP